MVFARSKAACTKYNNLVRSHKVKKRYAAVVAPKKEIPLSPAPAPADVAPALPLTATPIPKPLAPAQPHTQTPAPAPLTPTPTPTLASAPTSATTSAPASLQPGSMLHHYMANKARSPQPIAANPTSTLKVDAQLVVLEVVDGCECVDVTPPNTAVEVHIDLLTGQFLSPFGCCAFSFLLACCCCPCLLSVDEMMAENACTDFHSCLICNVTMHL
jgi:hypothetical protein